MPAKVLPYGFLHDLESTHDASTRWFQVHTLESSAPLEIRALDRLVDGPRRNNEKHFLGILQVTCAVQRKFHRRLRSRQNGCDR